MVYLVASLSFLGAFFCFFAWHNTGYADTSCFIGFMSCFFCSIFGYFISNLKDKVKKQEERIQTLEKHLNIKQEDPVMNSYIQDLDNKKTGD